MLSDFVAALFFASFTCTVNVEVPDAVGVPEIAPEEAARFRPAGREPLVTLHEYGVVPPLACNVAEYAVPTVPPDKLDVDTDNVGDAAAIAMLSDFVAVVLFASFTCTVKVAAPEAVGVPEITPEGAVRFNPAGREPVVTLHEYGVLPPVACRVAEYAEPTVPLGRDDVETATDPFPEPDPPVEDAPVTPAQPFSTGPDAIRRAATRYLTLQLANSLWSRASMIAILFRNYTRNC